MDTLKAYETPIGADMPDRQARALISIVQELQEAQLADVARKGDLAGLQTTLRDELEQFRLEFAAFKAEVRTEIAAVKNAIHELELTTKADIALLRSEMKERAACLEAKRDRVKLDRMKWFIPLILGQGAFIVGLLKLIL